MYQQSEKNSLSINIFSTCLHNMVNFGPLTAEICWRVWGTPANFNRFRLLAALLHRRRSTEVNKTLQDVWPSPTVVHYMSIVYELAKFLTEFASKFTLRPSLTFSYILATLLHGTRAAAVSETLWHGTRNGIRELSQSAPPTFGWAAITLGIGPHSS